MSLRKEQFVTAESKDPPLEDNSCCDLSIGASRTLQRCLDLKGDE